MKTTYRSQIMDFVEKCGMARRTDIIRYLREELQGKTFNPIRDRGYYSCAFWNTGTWAFGRRGYLLVPSRNDRRYLKQDYETRKYYVAR